MKRYARVETLSGPKYGEVDGETVWLLDGAPWWSGVRRSDQKIAAKDAKWLAPSDASKVVAVGQNYKAHAAEMGKPLPEQPLLFIKPSTSLNGSGAPIFLPKESAEVHHEAELGLIIGERLFQCSEAEAKAGIFAVTCFNDVTARDIQRKEVQFTRAKGFDTFSCCGPWMVRGLDWSNLELIARVNGVQKQRARTSDMVFDCVKLVHFISQGMTLLPGDIIATGTPSGVGPIRDGETVEIEIPEVGVLSNPVRMRG